VETIQLLLAKKRKINKSKAIIKALSFIIWIDLLSTIQHLLQTLP